MMTKKKILIVLHNALYVRNFISSGFVEKLAAHADVTVLIDSQSLQHAPITASYKIEPLRAAVRTPRWKSNLREVLREFSVVQNSDLSSTQNQRLEGLQGRFLSRIRTKVLLFLRPHVGLEDLARRIENLFPVAWRSKRFIAKLQPDEIFYSSSIHDDKFILDLLKAARARRIPITNFISSWDNLTTKGFFLLRPDRIFVWGESDIESALTEHQMKPEQVIVTGAPHFDHYFSGDLALDRAGFLRARGLDPAKKLILFAGTTLNKVADEPALVLKIQEFIARGEIPNAQIWYRPHPRSRYHRIEELRRHPEIYIDDQILRMPKNLSYAVAQEDLAHYPQLLNATDLIVTLWSTMMVEGALYGKPAVVAGFSMEPGANHIVGNFQRWLHLKMVLSWPHIKTTRSLEELRDWINRYLEMPTNEYAGALRERAGSVINNIYTPSHEKMLQALLDKDKKGGIQRRAT